MKTSQLPEIRIKDAWLLRANASRHLHELWASEGDVLADDKWMEKRVEDYKAAWKPYEENILRSMCELLGLKFRKNIIDVYIAPWFHAFSEPLIIGVMREPDQFIDTLTHELLHVLLTDNKSVPNDIKLANEWFKLFGKEHSFTTIVHIPVHAVHKAIYIDVLREPERLKRDQEYDQQANAKDYLSSWEFVNNNDYKDIIEKLKQSYKQLAKI